MVGNKRNELIIKHIDYLRKHHGYTKKAIADIIGVPKARLTTVISAKKYDVDLEKALTTEFPELHECHKSKEKETSKKELLKSYIARLVNEFGYSKKIIAQVLGVPSYKISNVIMAKTLDYKLLNSIVAKFPEVHLPSAEKSKKEFEDSI